MSNLKKKFALIQGRQSALADCQDCHHKEHDPKGCIVVDCPCNLESNVVYAKFDKSNEKINLPKVA